MMLPFTDEQFFDVFAQYNHSLWLGALLLWLASTAVLSISVVRGHALNRWLTARLLVLVPFIWCLIGGSAAILFGVYSDWALFVAAGLLMIHVLMPRARYSGNAG